MQVTRMVSLEISEQEAQALVQLLDAAVRYEGLSAAGAASTLAYKIQQAVTPPAPEPDEESDED